MAKIKQGILGGFSGKVAGVVGTSWKGRAVMKSRPLSVANPKTDAQVEQRGKFSEIAKLASAILTTFVQPVENPISGDVSGYNKFVKDNKAAFAANGTIQVANFVCGGGKLPFADNVACVGNEGEEGLTVTWENPAGTSALRLTDKVYAVAVNDKGEVYGVSSGTRTRTQESASIVGNAGFDPLSSGDWYCVLVAFVSADGREVSVMQSAIVASIS